MIGAILLAGACAYVAAAAVINILSAARSTLGGPVRRVGGTLDARNDAAAPSAYPRPTGGSLAAFSDDTRLTPEDAAQLLAAIDNPPAPTPRSIEAVRLYRERVVAADDAGKPWGKE